MFKICTKCKTNKTFGEFNKCTRNQSGVRAECRECQKLASKGKSQVSRAEYKKKHQLENRKKYREATQRYREKNRELTRLRCEAWRRKNLDKDARRKAKRRALSLKAIPNWLTREDYRKIESFYTEARNLTKITGIIHEVDHIIPLQGETVCGLHVPSNLQILTKSENCKKRNKFDNEIKEL